MLKYQREANRALQAAAMRNPCNYQQSQRAELVRAVGHAWQELHSAMAWHHSCDCHKTLPHINALRTDLAIALRAVRVADRSK